MLVLFIGLFVLALPVVSFALAVAALKRAHGRATTSLEARVEWLEGQLAGMRRRLDLHDAGITSSSTDPAPAPAPPAPAIPAPAPVAAAPVPPTVPLPPLPPIVSPSTPVRETSPSLEQRIGARWATWVGIVSLVITVGLILRWTFENHLIGPKGRVALGLVSGTLLLASGLVMNRRKILPFLSDGLAGGGLAILYLSLFAASNLYHFIGTGAAFGSMALVTLAGIAIAVVTGRQAIAVLAILGGLLTPILVSTSHPDERVLLGYLLVLDALVLGVARYRSWMGLNRFAWAGTVVLLFPVLAHHPETPHPIARLALLSALGGLFLFVPLAQAWAERRKAGTLDLALVIGNAAAYFSAVYVTLEPWRWRLEGPWALALGVLYVAVARVHKLRVPEDDPAVGLHLGLALVFAAIAAPLQFDGPWVTMAWAVLGAVCVYLASRRVSSIMTLVGGLAILGLATIRAAALDVWWYHPEPPVWNVVFAVHLAVVAALAWAGWAAVRKEGSAAGVTIPREDLRSALWFAAAGLLAILLWREPQGLFCPGLLLVEMLALAWLARTQRDPAFVFVTPVVAAVLFLRLFFQDATIAGDAAGHWANGPFLLRLAACAAVAIAGRWLVASSATAQAAPLGRFLRGFSGLALLVALSAQWILHERAALASATGEDARNLRWKIQVGLSVLWTLYAAAALAWGFVRSVPPVRWAALALFGVVVAKVFLVDLAELQAIYRILSFFVLGLVLLGVSYFYQRMKPAAGASS